MNEIGIISEVRGDKARVAIGSMVTDFLPVFQSFVNSFAVSFSPIRVGEQVLVLPIRGELNSGVILRGLFQNSHKTKPTDKKVHIEFEDGAKFSYDVRSSTLEMKSAKLIDIVCKNADIKADEVTVKSPVIKLLGDTIVEGSFAAGGGSFSVGGGSVKCKGDFKIEGNLSVTGAISDSKGDLTNHSHKNSEGGTALPR